MKQNPKKVKVTNLNAPIPEFKGKDIEGTTYRDIFTSLSTEDQIGWLVSLIEDSNEQIFKLQQQVDYLQEETGLSVNEVEMLQRKHVWTKEEVEGYFKVDLREIQLLSTFDFRTKIQRIHQTDCRTRRVYSAHH